jgi:biotin operon repressor
VSSSLIGAELGVSTQNVYRNLEPLVDIGVLVPSGRQRDRVWRAPEVLDAIDAFAERAGRRRPGRV